MTPRIAILEHQVALASADGALFLVDDHGVHAIADGSAEGVVAVGDEYWTVRATGGSRELVRYGADGRARGDAAALPASGTLIAGAYGAVATWNGPQPVHLQRDPDGALHAGALEPCDLALALRGNHLAIVDGATLSLGRRMRVAALPSGHRAFDGAALFDGTAVCVLAEASGGRVVALVLGSDGALRLRLALVGAFGARLAPARGQLVVQTAPTKLTFVDLRFGKVVRKLEHHASITDFAIDRGGYSLAIVDDSGSVVVYAHRDRGLAVRYQHELVVPASPEATARIAVVDRSSPPIALESLAPEGGDDTIDDDVIASSPRPRARGTTPPALAGGDAGQGPSLEVSVAPASLAPRPSRSAMSAVDAELSLDALRGELRARCKLAIAHAWDIGRICFTSDDRLPCQTEVAGLAMPTGGRATAELAAAREHLKIAVAARVAKQVALGGKPTPFEELAIELALSPLEQDLVLAIAAPELWSELARLYTILGNEQGRPICDPAILAELFADRVTEHDLAAALAPDARLLGLGLVRASSTGRLWPALTPTPQLLRRLRGGSTDHDPDGTIAVHGDDGALDDLLLSPAVRARVRAVLDGRCGPIDAHADAPLRLAVRGRPGSGRRTLLARLAATAGRRLALVDAAPWLRSSPPRLDALARELQRAHLAGWLPCVDGLPASAEDPQLRDSLAALVRDHRGPLCFRLPADGRAPVGPGHVVIDLATPGHQSRVAAWRHALGTRAGDPEVLAARWSVGIGTIHRAVARAGATGDVGEAVRGLLDDRLASLASRVSELATWDDVVLPPELLDSLSELIARVRHRSAVLERWGLAKLATTGHGVVALFQGGPGTGKTLVAGAIARELGLDLYRVDLARVVSKWIGETERNLGALFDAAEDGNAILLFDEADSLFARRTEVRTSVDRYANLEVNYLLQRLDSFTGIAILTSNFGSSIDEAFKRRLSFRLGFPFPDEEMREQLWRVHLPPSLPRAGELDLATLATRHALAGGYIRNAALRAAFLAAGEGSSLRQEHLERAIHLEYREIGRLSDRGRAE